MPPLEYLPIMAQSAATNAPNFTGANLIRDLHCQWESNGSRAWEADLRAELLQQPLTLRRDSYLIAT